MGKVFESITDDMRDFVRKQHVFFVASAPAHGGRINVSPKGLDTFVIDGPHRVAYLDLTGSGAETIAHLRENGRITIMFCAFQGPPNIVRFYGTGRVLLPGADEFEALAARFPPQRGARSIVVVDVDRTSTSCGYGVPFMEHTKDRPTLEAWADAKDDGEISAYWAEKNRTSIDGLPAIDQPYDGAPRAKPGTPLFQRLQCTAAPRQSATRNYLGTLKTRWAPSTCPTTSLAGAPRRASMTN